jgi:predicted RNA-binding protein (virulence factor B family)
MAKIGEYTRLSILREKPMGYILDGGELGEVLLPRREAPRELEGEASVDVFLYTDSEDRPIATTKRPKVMPGEFGRLKCVEQTQVGAFLDWGLSKDLLVPFREQAQRMQAGRQYLVYVSVDPVTDRVVATSRINRVLGKSPHDYKMGQRVNLIIAGKTDLGYNAIIERAHKGLLFGSDVHQDLQVGERIMGYVTAIKPDGKIDLSLQPHRGARVGNLGDEILAELKARGGFWPIGDHSDPEQIRDELGCSKRTFKQAIGGLLKRKKIKLEERGIRLVMGQ